MNLKFNIWVFLKKGKIDNNGLCPIYMRIKLNGECIEKATKLFSNQNDWNTKNQRSRNNDLTNLEIESQKAKIYNTLSQLLDEIDNVTVYDLKNRLNKKTVRPTILSEIQAHNQEMESQVPSRYSPGTLKNYLTLLKHVTNFLSFENRKDIYIKNINHGFIIRFQSFLLAHTNCTNNGATKVLQSLKKITTRSRAFGFMQHDPFSLIKFKKKPFTRGFLNLEELNKIETIELSPALERARDLFVFSCYTGLSYIDVDKLREHHIVKGSDGLLWIKTKRKKTNSRCDIPLLKRAERIINKYNGKYTDRIFKKLTNQRVNTYLKEIAALCSIDKRVTFHLARHTFATTVTLNNNIPIETVSKMLGHSRINTTQIYAKILEKKVGEDMLKIRDI